MITRLFCKIILIYTTETKIKIVWYSFSIIQIKEINYQVYFTDNTTCKFKDVKVVKVNKLDYY